MATPAEQITRTSQHWLRHYTEKRHRTPNAENFITAYTAMVLCPHANLKHYGAYTLCKDCKGTSWHRQS